MHVDGGYADYVCLPAGNFLPIPEGLDYEGAAVAADAVNTPWHCMRERAQINPHDDVLLVGAGGGVGIHGVQVAKLFGARVIAADIAEDKLELAREWGAVDFHGSPETFQACIDALTRAGRAVVIGAQPGDVKVNPIELVITEKIVTGSRHSTRAELIETMEVMARGDVKAVVGKRVHFTEVESLFDDLKDQTLLGRGGLIYD